MVNDKRKRTYMDVNYSMSELRQTAYECWINSVSVRADLDRALLAIDRLEGQFVELQENLSELASTLAALSQQLDRPEEDAPNWYGQKNYTEGLDAVDLPVPREHNTPATREATVNSKRANPAHPSRLWEPLELSFQEEYRGPFEQIKTRLSAYLLEVLAVATAGGEVLDIGCGRGEWLELLEENGITATGVDIDPASVEQCVEKGLDARLLDGIEVMISAPANSHSVITAFHVIEHLPLESQLILISEAFRILRPGGVLLMETPNPQNLFVATHNFYLDPTHIRPMPPALLGFLTAHLGFERIESRFLDRTETPLDRDDQSKVEILPELLRQALNAAADYAVLAYK